jgi:hypothetical protein
MMTPELYDILMNAGPISLLAVYLMQLNGKQEKRLDEQTDRYLQKIEAKEQSDNANREALLQRYEKREDELRKRYDDVIHRLEVQRTEQVTEVKQLLVSTSNKLETMSSTVQSLQQKTDKLEGTLEGIQSILALRANK